MPTEFAFRKNETCGSITLPVLRGLKPTIDTAVVTFVAKDSQGNLIFADAPASISGPVLSNDGVTKRGTFLFSLASAAEATANEGIYTGYFKASHTGGAVEVWPKHDSLRYRITSDFEDLSEAAVSGGVGDLQQQTLHGFSVFDLIRWDAPLWAGAQADSDTTLAQGIVSLVPNVNEFRVILLSNRIVTFPLHGKGAAGTPLYLSQATAKATITVRPLTGLVQQFGVVKDANNILLQSYGVEVA